VPPRLASCISTIACAPGWSEPVIYRGNLYSGFVSFAKIVLPLAAIGLLASLFLLAGGPEETERIPYSDIELDEIISGQRLASPNYQSVLADGSALSLVAERGLPDQDVPGRIRAEEIIARLTALDGLRTLLTAPKGIYDEDSGIAAATGGVRIRRSDGYVATTPGFRTQIDGRAAETLGQLIVEGPGLYLKAGLARLTQGDGGAGSEVLVFSGGIKLIYYASAVHER
jgi:lipopolysaccharide export system protein LptC